MHKSELEGMTLAELTALAGKLGAELSDDQTTLIYNILDAQSLQAPIEAPKKRGRKPKVDKVESSSETIPVATSDTPGLYEYLVNEIKADNIEEFQDKLNRRGNEGWELCGFDTNRYSLFGDIHIIAVFKRKRG